MFQSDVGRHTEGAQMPNKVGGGTVGGDFTEDEQKVLKALLVAVKRLRIVEGTLRSHHIESLLEVALNEGLTVSEYKDRTGVAHSVQSRHLLDLSEMYRNRSTGLGLLRRKPRLENLKETEYTLSGKGKNVLMDIAREGLQIIKGSRT